MWKCILQFYTLRYATLIYGDLFNWWSMVWYTLKSHLKTKSIIIVTTMNIQARLFAIELCRFVDNLFGLIIHCIIRKWLLLLLLLVAGSQTRIKQQWLLLLDYCFVWELCIEYLIHEENSVCAKVCGQMNSSKHTVFRIKMSLLIKHPVALGHLLSALVS